MTNYSVRYAAHPEHVKQMDTQELRKYFHIESLFAPNELQFVYTHYDRYVAGGAMPQGTTLRLEPLDDFRAEYFLERRELGIFNVGAPGTVTVDGTVYELQYKEALYVGQGCKVVEFDSLGSDPALFYMNSAPAHRAFATKKVGRSDAEIVQLGSAETCNARTLNKMLVNPIIETCQLQMGMTEMKTGSVWNTMPAHTHDRRMEIYFYFEIPEGQAVSHFMGQPQETRHIWMHNQQAVISPPWSIHAGAGTSNYTFIWGMAGENLNYGDMDKMAVTDLL